MYRGEWGGVKIREYGSVQYIFWKNTLGQFCCTEYMWMYVFFIFIFLPTSFHYLLFIFLFFFIILWSYVTHALLFIRKGECRMDIESSNDGSWSIISKDKQSLHLFARTSFSFYFSLFSHLIFYFSTVWKR